MLYNVSQLLMEPTGSTRRFPLDEPLPPAPDAVGAPDAARQSYAKVVEGATSSGLRRAARRKLDDVGDENTVWH